MLTRAALIDVSEVEGADVSGGFGSVYFSTSGPTGKDDILVAEFESATATNCRDSTLYTLDGAFYVTGK